MPVIDNPHLIGKCVVNSDLCSMCKQLRSKINYRNKLVDFYPIFYLPVRDFVAMFFMMTFS